MKGGYGESRFELPDRTVRSITRSVSATGLVVQSRGERWANGIRLRARKSTFENYDLALETGPAVEFSFFPYSESTRRALTAGYSVQVAHFDYTEETLFDRFSETRGQQNLRLALNLRLFRGSSLDVNGVYSRIRNQLNIAKRGAAFEPRPTNLRGLGVLSEAIG